MKTVMVIDAGGRGAVLVDKYGQSKQVDRILVIPGNDLMQINTSKKVVTYPGLKTTSVAEILEIVKKEKVDLVDVAQDNAVEAGLTDELNKMGVMTVGPTRRAGQIEWNKAWARDFMVKYEIPAPKFHTFKSIEEGIKFVKKVETEGRNLLESERPRSRRPERSGFAGESNGWFVKASGLAEGKGAIPASNYDEAVQAIREMQKFGLSGKTYLLEEWLIGEEFSAFALCDGDNFKVVGYAQDHKRVNDGDTGPNTGGMGCVSNPLIINSKIKDPRPRSAKRGGPQYHSVRGGQISNIFKKTVKGLVNEGRPYKGVLYLGGMVVGDRVYVIEFNARWGDPEAQVIVPSIKNDFVDVGMALIAGKVGDLKITVDDEVRVVVAAVAKGYPIDYSAAKGKKVTGIEKVRNLGLKVYGAGIKKENGEYIVNGGRVLYIVGEGKDVMEARSKVYEAMKLINIEGDNLHYRTDIGWRDLERIKE